MLDWFHKLMPREERFFELFARHAELVVAGARALGGLLQGGASVARFCQEIMDREADADEIIRQVLTAVRRTFITPLDRGDITNLITSMDDAIDQMNKTAKAALLYEVKTFEQPMRDMGECIAQAASIIREAVPLLSSIGNNATRLNELTETMIHLEEKADQLHERGLKELYVAHRDSSAMAFFVGSEIYDHLEKVMDRFEDVANEISAIVIEHV
jgi:predicted phosphate transport protein (TIGR00153 family)